MKNINNSFSLDGSISVVLKKGFRITVFSQHEEFFHLTEKQGITSLDTVLMSYFIINYVFLIL